MKKVPFICLFVMALAVLNGCNPMPKEESPKGGDDKVRVSGGPKHLGDSRAKIAWCIANINDKCTRKINVMPRFPLGSIIIQGGTLNGDIVELQDEYLITFNDDSNSPLAYGINENKKGTEWRNMRINRPIKSIPGYDLKKVTVVVGPKPAKTDEDEVTITLSPDNGYVIVFSQKL